jgi:hypothetical protein
MIWAVGLAAHLPAEAAEAEAEEAGEAEGKDLPEQWFVGGRLHRIARSLVLTLP